MPNPDNNQLMQQLVKTVEHPIRFLSLAGQRVANNALAFAADRDLSQCRYNGIDHFRILAFIVGAILPEQS